MVKQKKMCMHPEIQKLVRMDMSGKTFSRTFKQWKFISRFLELYPQLKCLSFLSLHHILILKDPKVQARVITSLLDRIENPKISNYSVQKIITSEKRGRE